MTLTPKTSKPKRRSCKRHLGKLHSRHTSRMRVVRWCCRCKGPEGWQRKEVNREFHFFSFVARRQHDELVFGFIFWFVSCVVSGGTIRSDRSRDVFRTAIPF